MQKRKRASQHDRTAVWSNLKTQEEDGSDVEWTDDNTIRAIPMTDSSHTAMQHDRKRRHVEHEIGPPMSNMSLSETYASSNMRDEEMTEGGSYEISPNRIYVHSLEDSSDEEDAAPQDMSCWEVNPLVARRLESEAREQQAWKVPSYIKPHHSEEKESSQSGSLVLWQPPPWATEPVQAVDRAQDTDRMWIEL